MASEDKLKMMAKTLRYEKALKWEDNFKAVRLILSYPKESLLHAKFNRKSIVQFHFFYSIIFS